MTHNPTGNAERCPVAWCRQPPGHTSAHLRDINTLTPDDLVLNIVVIGDAEGHHIRIHVNERASNTFFDVMPDAAAFLGRAMTAFLPDDLDALGEALILAVATLGDTP